MNNKQNHRMWSYVVLCGALLSSTTLVLYSCGALKKKSHQAATAVDNGINGGVDKAAATIENAKNLLIKKGESGLQKIKMFPC